MKDNEEMPTDIEAIVQALRTDLEKLTAELPVDAESALTFHPGPEAGQ